MAFNLLERLKKIKTPERLKPFMGELLFVKEPDYGKAMVFPVEEKELVKMREKKLFEPKPYLPEPKAKYPEAMRMKIGDETGYFVGGFGGKFVADKKITSTQKEMLTKGAEETAKVATEAGY